MRKKDYYLTLDCETATLPFASALCKTNKDRQTVAIAKPLIYDIGWVISDRQGNIIKTASYLVQETFFVPQVFNTAYYRDKRPKYMQQLANGEITSKLWNDIIAELLPDLQRCKFALAYNACFDFKKALPFTERYMKALYSDFYNEWEKDQYSKCEGLIMRGDSPKNPDHMNPHCKLRHVEFDIVDLWGLASQKLVNNKRYKNFCLKNGLVTASAIYFKTSAESVFQYLTKDEKFIEDHMALSDALIETKILAKVLKKGKIEPSIIAFPFRELGYTYDYVKENPKYKNVVVEKLEEYLDKIDECTPYGQRILGIFNALTWDAFDWD